MFSGELQEFGERNSVPALFKIDTKTLNVIFGEMFPISPPTRSIEEIGKTSIASESLTKKSSRAASENSLS